MAKDTGDQAVLDHIKQLYDEEQRLFAKNALSDEERHRLQKINIELDQAFDLLRQRRALREFGRDPDEAEERPPNVVEGYQG
ncbi:MAG TPA: DUF2630 family protein [Bauldia sp.]|nr:DUF2630 family protein [Bauldia sp.]